MLVGMTSQTWLLYRPSVTLRHGCTDTKIPLPVPEFSKHYNQVTHGYGEASTMRKQATHDGQARAQRSEKFSTQRPSHHSPTHLMQTVVCTCKAVHTCACVCMATKRHDDLLLPALLSLTIVQSKMLCQLDVLISLAYPVDAACTIWRG
jgi:hypothetical protein